MYFFSDQHRLNNVLNQTIDEISLSEMDVLISLNNGAKFFNGDRLDIEKSHNETVCYFDRKWLHSDNLHRLLGQTVISIFQDANHNIKLELNGGWKLVLHNRKMSDESLLDISYSNYTTL